MRKITISLLMLLSMFQLVKAQNISSDTIVWGGAFRYTYMNNSWDDNHKETGGRAIFDVAILKVSGRIKGIDFAVENRYYAPSFGGFMLRNAYVGLPLSENLKLKLGMPRTPFGILPFTGNSFMFNMQYYLGFEDDADIGALLEYKKNNWEMQVNFAKNSEDIFSQGNKRYAYDITGSNQETNQFTGRAVYHFGANKQNEIGVSAQYGSIYNLNTKKQGSRHAQALHAVIKKDKWDFKFELMAYNFTTKDTTNFDYIEMGAFAANYQVAKKGLSYSVSLGYTIDVGHVLLNDIKFYNDFSALEKGNSAYSSSYMNVTGCMIHTGPIYMLVDYVLAKNHPWIGTNYTQALSIGGDSEWNTRFNINLGVYF